MRDGIEDPDGDEFMEVPRTRPVPCAAAPPRALALPRLCTSLQYAVVKSQKSLGTSIGKGSPISPSSFSLTFLSSLRFSL